VVGGGGALGGCQALQFPAPPYTLRVDVTWCGTEVV
jgi:hypothetical protein